MIKLGLTGYPLGHSLSPQIHDAALRDCGLEGDYCPFPIRPEDKPELHRLLACVRSGEVTGLNVTVPHKQNVLPLMDELTPTAQAIGAVNTIYLREQKLIGDNTDAAGFLTDLKRAFSFSPFIVPPSALVLGAGGSARAVVYALANDGWNVTIVARRLEQANHLATSFANRSQIHIVDFADLQVSTYDLIVNTTPVGMTPEIDRSPLPENTTFSRHTFLYDLVYNPRETRLVREARAQGLQATTGLGMLIEQAALAFEIWTGCKPSREVMRASINDL